MGIEDKMVSGIQFIKRGQWVAVRFRELDKFKILFCLLYELAGGEKFFLPFRR